MEYFENQSRRNNIRIDGIPGEPNETWEETEPNAKVALKSKLNLSFEDTTRNKMISEVPKVLFSSTV